jgi:hypothetical protein
MRLRSRSRSAGQRACGRHRAGAGARGRGLPTEETAAHLLVEYAGLVLHSIAKLGFRRLNLLRAAAFHALAAVPHSGGSHRRT